jgi:hypothetical protein
MPKVSDIVNITITRETKPASRSAFGIALLLGDSGKLPDKDIIYLDIDAQLVSLNQIDGYINGDAITPVVFTTDNDTTMGLLATEIASHADVGTAVASDNGAVGYDNRITITAAAVDTVISLTNFLVTLGASQPTITITRNAFARTKSYASLSAVGADFAITDPEYIAASAFFGNSPNPGELKIGRVDSGEDWDDALDAIIVQDNTWYAVSATTRTSVKVQDVAAWVEAQYTNSKNPKIFFTASDDANILLSGVTTDIAAIFAAAEYDRSVTLYHQDAALTYPELAWMAGGLSIDPGSGTWKFKELDEFDATTLTDAQRAAAKAKFANTYETYGDNDMTAEGQVASSEFIDIIRGTDWLESTMASNIFAILVGNDKIPYTNAGIAAVEAEVRAALDDGIDAKFLRAAPETYNGQSYEIVTKDISEASAADKSNRLLASGMITFQAKVAGAIHKVEITGTVAV